MSRHRKSAKSWEVFGTRELLTNRKTVIHTRVLHLNMQIDNDYALILPVSMQIIHVSIRHFLLCYLESAPVKIKPSTGEQPKVKRKTFRQGKQTLRP